MHEVKQPGRLILVLMFLTGSVLGQSDPAGRWLGAITLPSGDLKIAVDLRHDQSAWSGTIDIPAQGVRAMPLADVNVQSSNISFKMPGVPGDPSFEGTLSGDGQQIRGEFSQGPSKLPFRLERLSAADIEAEAKKQAELKLDSRWLGKLKAGPTELRLVLRIYKSPDGTVSAKLDSIDQGARDLEIARITMTEERLTFEMTMPVASYEGTFNAEHTEISGEWHQGGASLPLVFVKTDEQIELRRPQEPKRPYPYLEEEVAYENRVAGIKLTGTLTLPRTNTASPAVVLISGSGAQDRNETVMGHRPFLVLADYLTRKGVAVLRTDDRGVGGSTGSVENSTTRDFASDVLSGVEYLKSRPEIDAVKIGLIGHSEGGVIAPMVACKSSDVAFIVLMAGTGLAGEEILLRQAELLGRAAGRDEEEIAKNQTLQRALIEVVKTESDPKIAERKLRRLIENRVSEMTEQQRVQEGISQAFLESQVRMLLSPWLRYFLTYDPTIALRKVRCPVLAVSGSLDLQVPPKEDLEAIADALRQGGNNDFRTVELPGLNHLFQTARTGAVSEYSQIEETIAPEALELISDWILRHVQHSS